MRLTRNAISKAIKEKFGDDVKLHAANGYFYFYNDEAGKLDHVDSASVFVNQLNAMNLDSWIDSYEYIIKDVDMDYIKELNEEFAKSSPIKIGCRVI